MQALEAIEKAERIKNRVERLCNMSANNRRHPNDPNGYARIWRLIRESQERQMSIIQAADRK
jgi:hypothetical protein